MRLLHSTTLEFNVFHDDQIPPYLILSHTWSEEEVSYQEMRFLQRLTTLPDDLKYSQAFVATLEAATGLDSSTIRTKSIKDRAGYKKIEKTAQLSKQIGLDYFWIDTCCINKSSSAELQEAINSMFRWYQGSKYCAVYLEDAEPLTRGHYPGLHFLYAIRHSKWVTRGWTLQELIAPSTVAFYDREWNHLNLDKDRIVHYLCVATGIPEYVLITGDLSRASVARKMSWAACRSTTRREDRAYSLMGIFGINIGMLYGEGDNAFRRLQEEIVRTTPDDSIFAWKSRKGSLSGYCGLLATSPSDFWDSGDIGRGRGVFSISNLGLRIETYIKPILKEDLEGNWDDSLYLCMLHAEDQGGNKVVLLMRKLEPLKYARVATASFGSWETSGNDASTLYIELTPQIPAHFKSRVMHCFHLKRSSKAVDSIYHIDCVRPYELWNPERSELLIPDRYTRLMDDTIPHDHDFIVTDNMHQFVGMVWLSQVKTSWIHPARVSLQVLLGYDPSTSRVWCKILQPEWNPEKQLDAHASAEDWRAVLRVFGDYEDCQARDEFDPSALSSSFESGAWFSVKVRPGLCRGMISHIVEIDGLMHQNTST